MDSLLALVIVNIIILTGGVHHQTLMSFWYEELGICFYGRIWVIFLKERYEFSIFTIHYFVSTQESIMDKVAFYEQKGPIMLIVSIREKVR